MAKKKVKTESAINSKLLGLKYGFKSGLEERVASQVLSTIGFVNYEVTKLKFLQPQKWRSYTPDFILPNKIVVETKGRFTLSDRQKHLWLKEQYPDMNLRFVFTNPNAVLRKGSKTTYAEWCTKNGFTYAKGLIPEEWFKEV